MKLDEVYDNLSIFNFMSVFTRIGNSYLSKRYEVYGFGHGQHQFLLSLYTQDGITQEELTKRIGVDKATTTRAVNKLKELAYITVTPDEVDKRMKRVHLAPRALAEKEEILGIAKEWEKLLFDKLTTEDMDTLWMLCRKIIQS